MRPRPPETCGLLPRQLTRAPITPPTATQSQLRGFFSLFGVSPLKEAFSELHLRTVLRLNRGRIVSDRGTTGQSAGRDQAHYQPESH